MNKKVVLLLSGGVDSTALLYKLVNGTFLDGSPLTIYPVFVNYGQHTYVQEFQAVCAVLEWMRTYAVFQNTDMSIETLISVSTQVGMCTLKDQNVEYAGKHPAYVPYRNLVLLSLALSATEINQPKYVVMGVHNIDVANRFPDCSLDFMESMQDVLCVYHRVKSRPVCKVIFPFCARAFKSKADIIAGVPAELLALCASGYGDTLAAKLTTPANTSDHV